jgi:hypothetical protein
LEEVELQVDYNQNQLQYLVQHKECLQFFQQLQVQVVVMEELMEVLVMEQLEVQEVEQV